MELDIDDAALQADQPRALDIAFILGHTQGFEAFCEDLRATSWQAITSACQLSRVALEGIAQLYARAERPIIWHGSDAASRRHRKRRADRSPAADAGRDRARRGGYLSVAGHSNVQGDRTVGITEHPTKAFLDQLVSPEDYDPDCLTPSYKSVPVRIVSVEQIEDAADTWVGTEGLTGRLKCIDIARISYCKLWALRGRPRLPDRALFGLHRCRDFQHAFRLQVLQVAADRRDRKCVLSLAVTNGTVMRFQRAVN